MAQHSANLVGTKELEKKLRALGKRAGTATLRKAMMKSTTPVVRDMRQRVPRGKSVHKTYRGLTVSPGFASRNLRRRTRRTRNGISVIIGVSAQAYYAINFIDQGPHHITRRKRKRIKPYTLRRVSWFESVFTQSRGLMERAFVLSLRQEIDKAVRNGN